MARVCRLQMSVTGWLQSVTNQCLLYHQLSFRISAPSLSSSSSPPSLNRPSVFCKFIFYCILSHFIVTSLLCFAFWLELAAKAKAAIAKSANVRVAFLFEPKPENNRTESLGILTSFQSFYF